MSGFARRNVTELTVVLSAVALALVFGVVLGAVPEAVLPPASPTVLGAVPHLNAMLSALALFWIWLGISAIRDGRVDDHRGAMLTAFLLFVLFLVLYLYRVAHVGPSPFLGPDWLYLYAYLPLLAVHITLAVVCVPLLFYVVLLGVTHSPAELPGTPHPRVGRVAVALWAVSFTLGIVVYLLLHVLY